MAQQKPNHISFGTGHGVVHMLGDDGLYVVRDAEGHLLGKVMRRERHTVRTAYKGTRIGYDRTHTCWSFEFTYGTRPAELRSDTMRCYRSAREVLTILMRVRSDAS